MFQPVIHCIRRVSTSPIHNGCARFYSARCLMNSSRILSHRRNVRVNAVFKRHLQHPTEKNVLISNYQDIELPNCMVHEYVWQGMDKWLYKTAVVCGVTGRGFTYGQARQMSTVFAAALRNRYGLRDGDCVAIMLPNSPEYPLATLGALQAGLVVTTVNPIYTPEEVHRQLVNSEAKLIVTTPESYEVVKSALKLLGKELPMIVAECSLGLPYPEGVTKFSTLAENFAEDTSCLKEVRRVGSDTAFLPYSSGTTGLPKGVELTHNNITANSKQMLSGRVTLVHETTDDYQDVSLCVLPFFHIYGLVVTMLSHLRVGGKLVTLPKFVPETFLQAQAKYKGTVLFLVPSIVIFLGTYPDVNDTHLGSIKTVMSGSAPLAASDADRLLARTSQKKLSFIQGYGLTETSPVVLVQERGNPNMGSVGGLTPNTHGKIVALENEDITLGPNQVGELWVRGPQVMKGYYKNPKATEEIFRPGGWMKTGDLAYYDDNEAFYIADRLKELIKVKGYQVAPAEIEGILRNHPDLLDAAVIGIPHPTSGEVPKAFVVRRKKSSTSAESIMEYVAEKVASYKRLGDLEFVDAIPKNAAGKILRRELKLKHVATT